jgi:hypothetical protein
LKVRHLNDLSAILGVLLPLTVLTGCGGGGGNAGVGAGGNNSTRDAAITAALTAFGNIKAATPDAENQQMLAWFRANPAFVDSGITDGSTWAHTQDNTTVIMMNNRQVVDDGTRAFTPGVTRSAIDIPLNRTSQVINNFGGGNAAVSNKIGAMLTTAGYVPGGTGGSISQLGGLSSNGVFYIDTHGLSMMENDGKDTYYLMTSDVYDPNTVATHNAGLNSHFLSVMGEHVTVRDASGNVTTTTRGNYAISDRYAKANWPANAFGRSSFVFINACSSAKTNVFRDVCFAKGASAYAGWSGDVDNAFANKVAPFVFDRLAGANKVNNEADGPQRPFDYTTIAADMSKHGMTADVNGNTLGISQKAGTDFGILTPTISFMGVDEIKGELTVNGIFGTDQGKVTVGGTEVAIKGWGFNAITCDLPPDLSGDVIVEVRSHKSNVVQLTEWRAHFRTFFDIGKGTLKQEGFLDVNFRADIHSHRDQPHDTPIEPIVPFYGEKSSKGKFTASGIYVEGEATTTWTGSADLLPLQTPSPFNKLVSIGNIDVKQKKIDIGLQGLSAQGMTVTVVSRSGTFTSALPGTTGFLDGEFSPAQPVPALHLTLNNDFSINAGVREETDGASHFRLEWDRIVPISPPVTTSARAATVKRNR